METHSDGLYCGVFIHIQIITVILGLKSGCTSLPQSQSGAIFRHLNDQCVLFKCAILTIFGGKSPEDMTNKLQIMHLEPCWQGNGHIYDF